MQSLSTTSPYHRVLALYARNADNLRYISGSSASQFEDVWSSGWTDLVKANLHADQRLPDLMTGTLEASDIGKFLHSLPGHENPSPALRQTLQLYELRSSPEDQALGIIAIDSPTILSGEEQTAFFWFVNTILRNTRMDLCHQSVTLGHDSLGQAEQITQLFSIILRHINAQGDLWEVGGGRTYFENRVHFFTSRQAQLEFVLPAFPCKSTNLDKVGGTDPDKGEELALRRMATFIAAVDEIYEPGAKIWIVSDGHVFSDCIGADDQMVDTYSEKLLRMRDAIFGSETNKIGFLSLADLFFGDKTSTALVQDSWVVATSPVESPITTSHTAEADLCRTLLMASCGVDGTALRNQIEKEDKASLALYRGFSKFMLEDLAQIQSVSQLSKSKRKKLASKVAFEMLKRNQAYSNLVEFLFPTYVRLSIHSHTNSGPKFGISLLGRSNVRSVNSLVGQESETAVDLLHIPTPWHNCLVKVVGQKGFLVTKARAVKQAIENGNLTGVWVDGSNDLGGYFMVQKIAHSTSADVVSAAVEGAISMGKAA